MGSSDDHPHFVFDLSDLEALYGVIKGSPFIRSNVAFSEIADAVELRYEHENGLLNAVAYLGEEQASGVPGGSRPVIAIYGGLIVWTRIASALVAERVSGAASAGNRFILQSRLAMLGNAQLQQRPGDRQAMRRLAVDALTSREVQGMAREIALGMETSVLAHELGHHCFGHTARERITDDAISRQDERDADAFAATLLATVSGSELTALGHVLFFILLAWQQHAMVGLSGRKLPRSTHPMSRTRAVAALRVWEARLATVERRFGITGAEILDLLPVEH